MELNTWLAWIFILALLSPALFSAYKWATGPTRDHRGDLKGLPLLVSWVVVGSFVLWFLYQIVISVKFVRWWETGSW